jgi:glutathione synthase/RimK-type ligase-like ATP-grasp enzyme
MRLLVLTPALDEPRFAAIASIWLDRLSAALEPSGVRLEPRPWTDPGDLDGFDGVTTLLAWGYHQAQPAWDQLLANLADAGVPVVNGVDTLRWNTRKTYLAQLEAAGAPVVPTLFVNALDEAAVEQAHERFGDEIIVKPQVSGGAFATLRVSRGDAFDGLRDGPSGPAMLQPFMPAVVGEGELSLLYFNGEFSHAVGKVAQPGDFRVQSQHGGAYGAITPPPEAISAARRVLAAADRNLTYARIDLIRDPKGQLRLMELEAIEPDLYLEHAPDGGAAFARAMLWALD